MLFVASPAPDSKSHLVDIATGATVRTYRSNPAVAPRGAAFLPRPLQCVVLGQEQPVLFSFALGMQQPLRRDMVSDKITAIAPSPCGSLILAGGDTGCVFVWSARSGELLRLVKEHTRRVTSIAFAPAGDLVATASMDSTCRVHSVTDICGPNGGHARVFAGHMLGVHACAFLASAPHVVTAAADRTVRVFDAVTVQELAAFRIDTPGRSIAVLPCDTRLLVGCDDGLVCFVDLYTAAAAAGAKAPRPDIGWQPGESVVARPAMEDGHQDAVHTAVVVNGGASILTCSADGAVLLWCPLTAQLQRVVTRVKAGVCCAAVAPTLTSAAAAAHPSAAVALKKYPLDAASEFLLPAPGAAESAAIVAERRPMGRRERLRQKRGRGPAEEEPEPEPEPAAKAKPMTTLEARKVEQRAKNAALLELVNELYAKVDGA